jgi:hypothetical protein
VEGNQHVEMLKANTPPVERHAAALRKGDWDRRESGAPKQLSFLFTALFHHGARCNLLGAFAVTAGSLGRSLNVFILALLLLGSTTQMFFSRHSE